MLLPQIGLFEYECTKTVSIPVLIIYHQIQDSSTPTIN